MKKKIYRIGYGTKGNVQGFLNVLATNKKSAEQQVRKKTSKSVLS